MFNKTFVKYFFYFYFFELNRYLAEFDFEERNFCRNLENTRNIAREQRLIFLF